VNAPRITDHGSNIIFCVLCRLTSGAFTIDSSTPTFRRNLNEHPIDFSIFFYSGKKESFSVLKALFRTHFSIKNRDYDAGIIKKGLLR
jgi:hypothetical protein